MNCSRSAGEKAAAKLYGTVRRFKLPIFSSLISGLMAYLFVFTNKLLNLDEISGLFAKGSSISSGRWALWLSSWIFPDVSMPWINGMLSLLMLTAAVCIVIRVFEIKNPVFQLLLSCLMVVFPSQAVTFTYMFTCAPYALAVLLAAGSVYFTLYKRKWGVALGAVLLALSLGIYQAYLSLAVSLYLVYLIKRIIEDEWEIRDILRCGLRCIIGLGAGLVLYFVINKIFMAVSGTEYNSYADASFQTDLKSVLFGLRVAFTAFFGYFYRGYYDLVPTVFSEILHIACALIIGFELVYYMVKAKNKKRALLLAVCLLLLPFGVNCLYIVSALRHTLMLYSFVAVYVLAAVAAERLMADRHFALRDIISAAMALIVACNILYANKLYLKMKLEYENAYSFYQTLVTRIKSCPGFDGDTMVLISGDADNLLHESTEIDTSNLVGVMEGLINVYSRGDFLTYYTGFCPPAPDWEDWEKSGGSEELAKMPEYPYDGSVKKIGNFVVVKLG
ncbi:MAG: glucosyltransferase domain-containing protein [Candidatus Limivicinus sp.]|jgi:hypothetical protein